MHAALVSAAKVMRRIQRSVVSELDCFMSVLGFNFLGF